jgi:cytoskeletal protein CcmA (bactofilin family)
MAMFSSTTRESGPKPPARTNGPDGLSILAAGTRFTGELEVEGVIKIEGSVHGTVKSQGQVLVVKGGRVEGDIIARQAVVGGEVRGGILADDRVEIQATSVVNGDITTPQITVLEGGKINGKINMAKPAATGQRHRPLSQHEPDKKLLNPEASELRRTG